MLRRRARASSAVPTWAHRDVRTRSRYEPSAASNASRELARSAPEDEKGLTLFAARAGRRTDSAVPTWARMTADGRVHVQHAVRLGSPSRVEDERRVSG